VVVRVPVVEPESPLVVDTVLSRVVPLRVVVFDADVPPRSLVVVPVVATVVSPAAVVPSVVVRVLVVVAAWALVVVPVLLDCEAPVVTVSVFVVARIPLVVVTVSSVFPVTESSSSSSSPPPGPLCDALPVTATGASVDASALDAQ
jgi:hypothetical protein